jgi:hypothetical protein
VEGSLKLGLEMEDDWRRVGLLCRRSALMAVRAGLWGSRGFECRCGLLLCCGLGIEGLVVLTYDGKDREDG